jgi:hypothetical protein
MNKWRRAVYIAIMASTVLVVSQAEAAEYILRTTAVNEALGEVELVGVIEADTLDACVYNMGLLAGSWYGKGWVGDVVIPYQYIDGVAQLSFFTLPTEDTTQTFLFVMTCRAVPDLLT